MIAALPMYDRPEIAEATDALWRGVRDGLRARGIAAPQALTRGVDLWAIWQAPDLVFAQTCGLPYRARLHDRVTLIGAPVHAEGPTGFYHSVIIAADQALPPRPRLAVNDVLSQSGWANLANWLSARDQAHGEVRLTGAHRASARAVHDGQADLAAIDAVTWGMMELYDPWVATLHVIGQSDPVPALPFITAKGARPEVFRDALSEAIDALSPKRRHQLNLWGIEALSPDAYLTLSMPPALAPDGAAP